jgi:hypothetical protein
MKKFQDPIKAIEFLRSLCDQSVSTNERGCKVSRGFDGQGDRYLFDFFVCLPELGWHQYDTDQDAHYFGVWYNLERLTTFTYCEGDLILVEAPGPAEFKNEMQHAAEFYGSPPPAFKVIDGNTGQVTHVFDDHARPDLDTL